MSDEIKQLTNEQYDTEIKKVELELKKLEIEERKANTQDVKERLEEREMKRETKRQRSVTNGQTLRQIAANEKASQAHCNHRKGGSGAEGFVGGQGDDSQYAVLKHRMANADVWVRCLRCGKTWKPPVESQFKFNTSGELDSKGKFDEKSYLQAIRDYEAAVAFQTRNQMSSSVAFKFSDGGKNYREVTKDSSLR